MPRPELNWNISLGNMLLGLGMVISGAMAFQSTRSDLASIEQKLIAIEQDAAKRDVRISSNAERISIANSAMARQDERQNAIRANIELMRDQLTRIEEKIDRK